MTYARQLDRERDRLLAVFCDTSRHLTDDETRQMGERLEEIAADRARILTEFPPPRPKGRPSNRKAGLDTLR